MSTKKKWIIVISIVVIAIILVVGVKLLTSKGELSQKASEIFGSIYCDGNHLILAGDAMTPWTCELCGYSGVNPDTDAPILCNTCSNLTGRCNKCGKLEK